MAAEDEYEVWKKGTNKNDPKVKFLNVKHTSAEKQQKVMNIKYTDEQLEKYETEEENEVPVYNRIHLTDAERAA